MLYVVRLAPDVSKTSTSNSIHYEFGGPIGAAGIVFTLPLVVLGLYRLCNKDTCLTFTSWGNFNLPSFNNLISFESVMICIGWIAFHIILERILPGEQVSGTALPDGSRLSYIMSGHLQFWLTILLMGHAVPVIEQTSGSGIFAINGFMPLQLGLAYDHYEQLIIVSTVVAYLGSIYL